MQMVKVGPLGIPYHLKWEQPLHSRFSIEILAKNQLFFTVNFLNNRSTDFEGTFLFL